MLPLRERKLPPLIYTVQVQYHDDDESTPCASFSDKSDSWMPYLGEISLRMHCEMTQRRLIEGQKSKFWILAIKKLDHRFWVKFYALMKIHMDIRIWLNR